MKSKTPMNRRKIAVTPSAYAYPSLIKQLARAPVAQTAHQEIAHRDVRRFTYVELRDRIGRLANALDKVGVRPGDSVAANDPAAGSRVFDESRCVSGRLKSQWLIAPKPVNPNRIRFSDRAAPT
jgi:acyl-CoA synthetase (AMP-forming)/AMP-acid ligase II